eukprot:1156391-Pelagomonas_calceolata.AAC.1
MATAGPPVLGCAATAGKGKSQDASLAWHTDTNDTQLAPMRTRPPTLAARLPLNNITEGTAGEVQ